MPREKAGEEEAKQTRYLVQICPGCGKTVHLKRAFCDCHTPMSWADTAHDDVPPEIKPCNIETSTLVCADCPENCKWCAGHGLPWPNKKGFGGLECKWRSNSTLCNCCYSQIKIGEVFRKESIVSILDNSKNANYQNIAAFIRERMELPIRERITMRRRGD